MPLQTVSTLVGIAKQASKGTLAANPTFAHGVTGGASVSVEPAQSPVEVTTSKRAAYNMYRDSSANGGTVQSLAYLKSVGLYLLGAMGTDTVTGTNPYVHTFSTGDLPYLSLFTKGLDTTIEGIRDCKVDEFSLKWDGSKPVQLSAKLSGTVFSYPSTFTPTTDETASESYLIPVGGTFQVDTSGSTPATAAVIGGEITVKNNVSPIEPSASIEASDVWEGIQEVSLKLTIIPDSLADFRKTITGSAAGTSVASTVPTGQVNIVLKENAGGAGTLTITGTKIAFLTAFPEGDPKGGAVQIELAGTAVIPAAGTAPLVFALSNTQATY